MHEVVIYHGAEFDHTGGITNPENIKTMKYPISLILKRVGLNKLEQAVNQHSDKSVSQTVYSIRYRKIPTPSHPDNIGCTLTPTATKERIVLQKASSLLLLYIEGNSPTFLTQIPRKLRLRQFPKNQSTTVRKSDGVTKTNVKKILSVDSLPNCIKRFCDTAFSPDFPMLWPVIALKTERGLLVAINPLANTVSHPIHLSICNLHPHQSTHPTIPTQVDMFPSKYTFYQPQNTSDHPPSCQILTATGFIKTPNANKYNKFEAALVHIPPNPPINTPARWPTTFPALNQTIPLSFNPTPHY